MTADTLIEIDPIRQDFEDYIRSINSKLLFLERWPSGIYKHDAIQNQWLGYRAAVLSASAGEKKDAAEEADRKNEEYRAWVRNEIAPDADDQEWADFKKWRNQKYASKSNQKDAQEKGKV